LRVKTHSLTTMTYIACLSVKFLLSSLCFIKFAISVFFFNFNNKIWNKVIVLGRFPRVHSISLSNFLKFSFSDNFMYFMLGIYHVILYIKNETEKCKSINVINNKTHNKCRK
jgi:hypothetical protein